ncbi:MAG: hypothetical protein P8X74_20300 [Reinekea sp.]
MKSKLVEFSQYLAHEIEDDEKGFEYVSNILPNIGLIVMFFNTLESDLDSILCENFTDRTDSPGLIVLNKLNYSSKVDLLKRFCDDLQISIGKSLNGYDQIITNLNECGRLRNLVVHANWDSTDEKGYTFTKIKLSKQGMKQEYIQFTEDSMNKIIDLIIETRTALYEFWEHRNDVLYRRV